jgi:hypothetical protein
MDFYGLEVSMSLPNSRHCCDRCNGNLGCACMECRSSDHVEKGKFTVMVAHCGCIHYFGVKSGKCGGGVGKHEPVINQQREQVWSLALTLPIPDQNCEKELANGLRPAAEDQEEAEDVEMEEEIEEKEMEEKRRRVD